MRSAKNDNRAKLSSAQREQLLELLRIDLVTQENTRPAGKNDNTPPHEAIAAALMREAEKSLKHIHGHKDKLEQYGQDAIRRWNEYITFAFSPDSTADYYNAHKADIDGIADQIQSGSGKSQMDRQMIWRYRQRMPDDGQAPDDLARACQDLAIRHNTMFIMGTIGRALSSPSVHTDLDVADFAADAIEVMKKKMNTYDPTKVAVSTYMTQPIIWSILRSLKGKAQDRFDRSVRRGFDISTSGRSEEMTLPEVTVPKERDGSDGMMFLDEDIAGQLRERLEAVGEKLTGANVSDVFLYKLEHPDAILKDIGDHFGCTRENVRQRLLEAGRQLERIDPELAIYMRAMMNGDENGMDEDRLAVEYGKSSFQHELQSALEQASADMDAMREHIGADNITVINGSMKVRQSSLVGDSQKRKMAKELVATYEAVQALQSVLESPFVGASFDAMTLRNIQHTAFYIGGSQALTDFIEDHIEELAAAAQVKALAELGKYPLRAKQAQELVERFAHSGDEALADFTKSQVNALFCAPPVEGATVLARQDLLVIRKMGMALVQKKDLQLT